MKKFKIFYGLIIIISIIMILTKGIPGDEMISSYYPPPNVSDGVITVSYLSIYNCIIDVVILIATATITLYKNNKIKYKWWLFVLIFILVLFIPIGNNFSSGGIAGRTDNTNIYLWTYLRILKNIQ